MAGEGKGGQEGARGGSRDEGGRRMVREGKQLVPLVL